MNYTQNIPLQHQLKVTSALNLFNIGNGQETRFNIPAERAQLAVREAAETTGIRGGCK